MKNYLILSLLAFVALVMIACAPGEEAVAGQAYQPEMSGIVKSSVKSCTELDNGINGTDKQGKSFNFTNNCKTSTKVVEYFCATYSMGGGYGGKKSSKIVTNVMSTQYSCASGEQCQGGMCIGQAVCGNNVIEGEEVCDGTDLGSPAFATCNAQLQDPAAKGTVQCAADCADFDLSGCEIGEELEPVAVQKSLQNISNSTNSTGG